MMTSYECIFDGNDTARNAIYGVRVCTDYIRLQSRRLSFPSPATTPRSVAGG